MASQLQNRIVGSIILIALAVIILPELLDGRQVREQQEFEAMPLQPETEVVEQAVTYPETELEGTPIQVNPEPVELTADTAPELDQEAEVTAPQPAAPVTEALTEPGYVIQLGAFSNADSVAKLITELQAKGFAAYSETVQVNGKALIRLMVGPALTEAELEQQLPELQKLTGLNGRVIRFEP
ncbi:SPOR domain-containing protein [Pseudidiomarina salilacus]|uniref:SPOR domain-containing protein n=1 Tax=Pseudidiomarina salilacus TaxID=3384452 RepID=UPI0039851BC4